MRWRTTWSGFWQKIFSKAAANLQEAVAQNAVLAAHAKTAQQGRDQLVELVEALEVRGISHEEQLDNFFRT